MGKERMVGLDIGTTKVCAIISEIDEEGEVEILGVGTSPSHGVRKGVVIDIDLTTKSIEHALSAAKLMAGVDVGNIFVGIGGSHIKGTNSHSLIAIRDKEVKPADKDRVISSAGAITLPQDRERIHTLPQRYTIDGQEGIREPVGMSGTRLEVDVHIVTGAVSPIQNIRKCIASAGFEVEAVVLQSLATSYAVLTEDEENLGVLLVDIGGGTTDMSITVDGSFCHNEVFNIGGENITKDISIVTRTPINEAERLKKMYGCVIPTNISPDETIDIPSVGEQNRRTIPKHMLINIIIPRVEEIFSVVNQSLQLLPYYARISGGVVLTGGTSLLPGITTLAERIFDMPVRIGVPHGISGMVDAVDSPIYSTAVGLVLFGIKRECEEGGRGGGTRKKSPFKRLYSKMRELVDFGN